MSSNSTQEMPQRIEQQMAVWREQNNMLPPFKSKLCHSSKIPLLFILFRFTSSLIPISNSRRALLWERVTRKSLLFSAELLLEHFSQWKMVFRTDVTRWGANSCWTDVLRIYELRTRDPCRWASSSRAPICKPTPDFFMHASVGAVSLKLRSHLQTGEGSTGEDKKTKVEQRCQEIFAFCDSRHFQIPYRNLTLWRG